MAVSAENLLTVDNLDFVMGRRGRSIRLATGLQAGALRLMGFIPEDLSSAPESVVAFVADQVHAEVGDLVALDRDRGTLGRNRVRVERHLGFRRASPGDIKGLNDWLGDRAVKHDEPWVLFRSGCGWLKSELSTPEGPDVPRRIQVLEEIWALLGSKRVASYYQQSQKLARAYGVCNVAVAHRLSDLRAQSDDGTAAAKIATGILADTETRIMFRQPPDQIAEATEMLGLTATQARTLPMLGKGIALWQVGGMTAEVAHRVAPTEQEMCWTDGALAT